LAAGPMIDTHETIARIIDLVAYISQLALIAFGGIITVLPGIHHHFVDERHWMTSLDFTNLFALAQASPGPNVLMLTLMGYKIAGIGGAVAATLALTIPTSVVAFVVVRVWDRFREAHWRKALQAGVVPVAAGFIGAAAYVIARVADSTPIAYAVSLLTLYVAVGTKINPLWVFLVGAVFGLAGFM
jgi:chromate transporter